MRDTQYRTAWIKRVAKKPNDMNGKIDGSFGAARYGEIENELYLCRKILERRFTP